MNFLDFIRDRAKQYNCPVCSHGLEGCELRLVSQDEDRHTIEVTCPACRVQFQVVLVVESDLVAEIERPRPPARKAAPGQGPGFKTRPAGPVGWDEVLDVHLALKGFNGPLDQLLSGGGR